MSGPPLSEAVDHLTIVMPTWVGDVVMATCVLRAIRGQLPHASVVAVTRPGLGPLLAGGPWLNDAIEADVRGAIGPWRAARRIRGTMPRAILLLPNSFRSALTARLTGARVRVGYRRDGRSWLLTHGLAPARASTPTPTIGYYANLAAFALGVEPETVEPRPELFVTDEESAAAGRVLEDVPERFAVLNPGAVRSSKRWPAARFAALAEALHGGHDLVSVVTGGPAERELVATVVAAVATPVVDLPARGCSLGTLKAVIARATLLVTNDTGPRHIAAALGTPRITLFGPTDHRWTSLPDPRERLVLAEPFLPEEEVADRNPQLCAIDRITVGDVVANAESLLAAVPASTA